MKNRNKMVLGAALFFACTTVAFVLFERIRGQRAVRRIVAQMTATGAEMDARKLVPPHPASNAAPALIEVAKKLPEMRETPPLMAFIAPGRTLRVLRLDSWTNSQSSGPRQNGKLTWNDLSNRVAVAQNNLSSLHQALRADAYWSGFNYQRGFHDFETPGLYDLLNVSRWLTAEALVHARAGRAAETFYALESLTQLVWLLRDERLIISQLVRRASAAHAFYVLWHTMIEGFWTEAQLTTLQRLWKANDFRRDMFSAMEMERAMSRDHFRIQRSSSKALKKAIDLSGPLEEFAPEGQLPLKSAWVKLVALPMWRLAWSYHDEFNSLRIWQSRVRDAKAATRLPWSEMQHNTGDADIGTWQFVEGGGLSFYDQSRFLFSARSIFNSTVTLRNVYETEATKELVVAMIGIVRFRLSNGKLPESLEDLAPFGVERPYDPMDGNSLRYKPKSNDGFLLYSAGFNGIDDGGDPSIEHEDAAGIWRGKDGVWPEPSE
jgi:hypothetical protein